MRLYFIYSMLFFYALAPKDWHINISIFFLAVKVYSFYTRLYNEKGFTMLMWCLGIQTMLVICHRYCSCTNKVSAVPFWNNNTWALEIQHCNHHPREIKKGIHRLFQAAAAAGTSPWYNRSGINLCQLFCLFIYLYFFHYIYNVLCSSALFLYPNPISLLLFM